DAISARAPWLHKLVQNKYYIDEIYRYVIVVPLKAIGDFLALFDRYVVDGVVKLTAGTMLAVGRVGTRLQNGQLQSYGLLSLVGLLLFIVVFVGRRFFHVG